MVFAPDAVASADGENHKLIVEFAIPGAPADTFGLKTLEDSVHLTAPARDIEYVSALAFGWRVKPDKAEATYERGLLRREKLFPAWRQNVRTVSWVALFRHRMRVKRGQGRFLGAERG
jgi:hypothetical protein